MSIAPALEERIARFVPITLAEMDRVKLQARVDTKYVFGEHDMPAILDTLMTEYRLLELNGVRGANYTSIYLDTPERAHYLAHHNGRTFRHKVRFRSYVGSDLVFLEVKRKTGRGDTDKVRIRVNAIGDGLTPEQAAFVARTTRRNEALEPVLRNDFHRLTFVHRTRQERLTIDGGLCYSAGDRRVELTGIRIAELKSSGSALGSPFTALMRSLGHRPAGMSKYCVDLHLLGLAPKANAFKPVLRRLDQLRNAA